ncbi:MAG TPA: permease, partial [Micromonosporaceae bacterium]
VAVTAVRINLPIWHARLDDWSARLAAHTIGLAHGPQAAIALLLIAAAAAIVLPKRASATAVAISLGLTALILPATLHTGWWGPLVFSGLGATVAGLVAAASGDPVIGLARAGVATLLFANTIAASLVSAGNTATTLIASAGINAAVAAMGVRTLRRVRAGGPDPDDTHLVLITGGALAGAILTFAGGAATVAAAAHQPLTVVLTAAMAGLGIALAVIAPVAPRLEPVLPQVTGAISIGGLVIALAQVGHFTSAGVFASFAALLSVLSEVMRSSVERAGLSDSDGVSRRAPRRVGLIIGWFPQRTEVLLAAGPATTLAIASVAPTILAALVGPYRWLGMVWRGAPVQFHDQLGPLTNLVGGPVGVLTSLVLVATATIGVVGFGGPRDLVLARAVAVVTPGIAICLLIAPYLVRAAWPAGALAALSVATISGLALALIEPPIDLNSASSLHFARNLVVAICALSTGAGLSGSLAAQPMTIAALTIATITGAVAAGYGREQVSRVTGWIVTATAGQLLVLVICLVASLPSYDAAFAVGAVAGALLTAAALMPRLRKPENLTENLTVEVSAYAGAVLGLVLAARSIPHLAVFLAAWGAVLGIATARPQRQPLYRSALMWTGAAHELGAWFLLMVFTRVAVPEAYTLGIAIVALVTGWIESRWHPELTSWITYGIALAAALGPSLVILIATGENMLRLVLLLIGATAVLLFGAIRRQQAPTIIGAVALLGTTINLAARYSTTILVVLLLAIIAGVLIGVGANTEKQRRQLQRAWSTINKMQ